MLRALTEFLGLRSREGPPPSLVPVAGNNTDARLGYAELQGIPPVAPAKLDARDASRLACLHDGVSKRTSHPAFNKQNLGMNPAELD
ncbi:MAG TPA: hypothetical protein VFE25_08310, partial [Opitutaceae bacterium]|nr:hypothetical protein [Opitutaceae bacterium]